METKNPIALVTGTSSGRRSYIGVPVLGRSQTWYAKNKENP